jgi:hypothetical protein
MSLRGWQAEPSAPHPRNFLERFILQIDAAADQRDRGAAYLEQSSVDEILRQLGRGRKDVRNFSRTVAASILNDNFCE